VSINGKPTTVTGGADGYLTLARTWKSGDVVDLTIPLTPRLQVGSHTNAGRVALLYGPLVLAADEALLSVPGARIEQVVLPSDDLAKLDFTVEPAPAPQRTWQGARVFRIKAGLRQSSGNTSTTLARDIRLIPFADAGGSGTAYAVWLPIDHEVTAPNVLLEGVPSATGETESLRACADGEIGSVAVLRPENPAGAQGFSVALPRSVIIRKIVFAHGRIWGSGGWFDTSTNGPQFEVQRTPGGPWENVGALPHYPRTTATDGRILAPLLGRSQDNWSCSAAELARIVAQCTYVLELPEAISVVAVRVTGTPSQPTPGGPGVLTCAELQAYAQ
jgi:hypothetical protein